MKIAFYDSKPYDIKSFEKDAVEMRSLVSADVDKKVEAYLSGEKKG